MWRILFRANPTIPTIDFDRLAATIRLAVAVPRQRAGPTHFPLFTSRQ